MKLAFCYSEDGRIVKVDDSPDTDNKVEVCKELMRARDAAISHSLSFPGITIDRCPFTSDRALHLWTKNAEEWNQRVGNASLLDLVWLTRAFCVVAEKPLLIEEKTLSILDPLEIYASMHTVCTKWCVRPYSHEAIEELRERAIACVVTMDYGAMNAAMRASKKVEHESKGEDLRTELHVIEENSRISGYSERFAAYAARTFMNVDYCWRVRSQWRDAEIDVPLRVRERLIETIKYELELQPSGALLTTFSNLVFSMIMPLGAEMWYNGIKVDKSRKISPQIVYSGADEAGEHVSGMLQKELLLLGPKLPELMNLDTNNPKRQALLLAVFVDNFRNCTTLPFEPSYLILNDELVRRRAQLESTHLCGYDRWPIIVQIGPEFLVHDQGRFLTMTGDVHRNAESAIAVWLHLVATVYKKKLSLGQDVSEWFKMFL